MLVKELRNMNQKFRKAEMLIQIIDKTKQNVNGAQLRMTIDIFLI